MTMKNIAEAKDPDLRASVAAMQRAALIARYTAIQTNTDLVIMKNGQLLRVSPEELRQNMQKDCPPQND
ncbi:hypothetical protein [Acidithiobacillus sulfurivorans]|uniref:Uncharacterized protein n=1 Tax=Acidithiobacillus sulfurivorans TaxID=1958756 RepID=A0ABS5ZUB1_9PROT|nr:hypothetical protein [Acidithiobacillus sulfurivorans]MBU2758623.1 hypothetical protein [Acidithiobacillus sulfurivorans]